MQRKYKLVVIVILSLFLIGGASMAIIKGVEHLRIEKKKRQKAESIKESKKEVKEQAKARQKIALWVVQHFEGPEPIKTIEVGKIESYGILGSGGKAVSVRINQQNDNVFNVILGDENIPSGGVGGISEKFEYTYVDRMDNDLENVSVLYWR